MSLRRRAAPESLAASSLLERLIFLSDGVFAIAMTLLVVELTLPEISSPDPAALVNALVALWPRYLSFGVSFVVIANYWTSHQRIFSSIVRTDSRLVWLNLGLLLCIAFQPFPTSVLGTYGSAPAVTFYAATLFVTGVVLLAMRIHATGRHRLVRADLDSRRIEHDNIRAAAVPLVFLVSIGIAQLDADAAKWSWLSIGVLMVLLRRIYRTT